MDLLKLIPGLYEDETDFVNFLKAIEPVIKATRQEIAGFSPIRRPERVPTPVLAHLLHMLGWSFEIIPPRVLRPEEEAAVSRCADFMKPAHTHYRILPPADHWELGVSELSINTVLH